MGLNVNSFNTALTGNSKMIDMQALTQVREQILNPNKDKTVDVSKLDLSKFNRVSLGTDLYSPRTSGETALQAAKAVTDYGINFSKEFDSNIQILNSLAAQSVLNSNDMGQKVVSVDVSNQVINEKDVLIGAVQTSETKELYKDKRGSNPFAFYFETDKDGDESETDIKEINIFA